MTRTSDVSVARRVSTARIGTVPSLALTAFTGLAILAQTGCQAFVKRNTPQGGNDPPPSVKPLGGDVSNNTKTDFHREATPEQGFNVHVEYARALESQGNFEAAVSEYQKAVDSGAKKGSAAGGSKLLPDQVALAERKMAGALDRLGRFTQAEIHYRKALALAPGDAKVWNDCGYSYYLQNRFEDALRALKTADKLEPNEPRVLTNLGLALAASGKTDEALEVLTRAGGPAVGHANLAYLTAALGKKEEAKALYQKALEIQPELTAAREALGVIDAQLAKGATAIASATPTAPKLDPVAVKPESPASADAVPASLTTTASPPAPDAAAVPPPEVVFAPAPPSATDAEPVVVLGSTVDPQRAPASPPAESKPETPPASAPAPESPPAPAPSPETPPAAAPSPEAHPAPAPVPPAATSAVSPTPNVAPADVQLVRTWLNSPEPAVPPLVVKGSIIPPGGDGSAAPRELAVDPLLFTTAKPTADPTARRVYRKPSNPAPRTPW